NIQIVFSFLWIRNNHDRCIWTDFFTSYLLYNNELIFMCQNNLLIKMLPILVEISRNTTQIVSVFVKLGRILCVLKYTKLKFVASSELFATSRSIVASLTTPKLFRESLPSPKLSSGTNCRCSFLLLLL
ncbi:hypothetical protein H5410_061451, partial [Solanum commersonii]